jgi:hypothetical protein
MPLNVYNNIYESGSVPMEWRPIRGAVTKHRVNKDVLRYLRSLLAGRWRKVFKKGTNGKVHYFEHESGKVAGVKFKGERLH